MINSSIVDSVLFFHKEKNSEKGDFEKFPRMTKFFEEIEILVLEDVNDPVVYDFYLIQLDNRKNYIKNSCSFSKNGEYFTIYNSKIRVSGPQLIILEANKPKINRYDDKILVHQLPLPSNSDLKTVTFVMGELLEIPDFSPGLVRWIKIIIILGFVLALLILILVVGLRKMKKIRGE